TPRGPEVEDDDLAAQGREPDVRAAVQPGEDEARRGGLLSMRDRPRHAPVPLVREPPGEDREQAGDDRNGGRLRAQLQPPGGYAAWPVATRNLRKSFSPR